MGSSKKYEKISAIAKRLSDQLDRLDRGELDLGDIESLTNDSKEVYERLVVLRYQAYESLVKEDTEPKAEQQPIPFQLEFEEEETDDVFPPNQTSLIDAIEELAPEEEEEAPEETQTEVIEEESVEIEEEQEVAQEIELDVSVNDRHKDQVEKTLAGQLKSSPIEDLKKAIGLNQKFRFINDLFEGEAEKYEAAIEKLNDAEDLSKAMEAMEALKKELEWDDESKSTIQIFELVERRHA